LIFFLSFITLVVLGAFALLMVWVVASRVSVSYALDAPYALPQSEFIQFLEGITNSPSAAISEWKLDHDPAEIYSVMLASIRQARLSVTMETFLFWSGEVGDAFAEAFIERARAGVKVKLLLDADGSRHLKAELLKAMRDAGCEVRLFRPFVWYQPVQYNHRTHRKLLIVDGCIGFTGGIGVADMWLGPPGWLEVMLRLEGPVVGLMQGAFFENWVIGGGTLCLDEKFFPWPTASSTPKHRGSAGAEGMVTASSPVWGDSQIRLLYFTAIASARARIFLASPYFLPSKDTTLALIEAARRGVDVRLLVPGPKNDKRLLYCASRRLYGPLLKEGVKIYEYQPAMMHAKTMLVDDRWATLGSTNFDPRSFFLNSELNTSIKDAAFAEQLATFFEGGFKASSLMTVADWQARKPQERLLGWLGSLVTSQL
jgi:cardiolipin synthase